MSNVIKIKEDGTCVAVYSDKWRPLLEAIGTMEVTRASEVEFDSTTGEWVANLKATGAEVARHTNRAKAIEAEIAYIEKEVL